MKKINPHLWFNGNAEEAVQLYTSAFPDSRIGAMSRYNEASAKASGQPAGSLMTVSFQLSGQDFLAINGGPYFRFSPATSFFVNCASESEVDAIWAKLSDGGMPLMALGEYPFSKRFGWVQDKFGVSWQINLGARAQRITPFLMFVGAQHGNAQAAMEFYVSCFPNSGIESVATWAAGEPGAEGAVKHGIFHVNGQDFMAMESNLPHPFEFTGAISFLVNCETQDEIDQLWSNFSQGGEEQQCGWIRDRFGVFWQVTPSMMGSWMSNPKTAGPVMKELLTMKKIDIARLQRVAERTA